ncbi:MAG: TetR/AcrR family transcriptional regulator [Pseudomonadota bacterium]
MCSRVLRRQSFDPTRISFPSEEHAITASPEHAPESERGEARRQQVLNAAADCFRDHGFHGTSIQRISLAAGMSPGHIYHYFENKEAIVAAIVRGYLRETMGIMEEIQRTSAQLGLVEAMVAQVAPGLALRSERGRIALVQEILAEASRNEAIGEALRQADHVVRKQMRELLQELPQMRALSTRELEARITVMNTLFDGFSSRTLCDPGLNKAATARIVQGIMRTLLESS